MLSPRKMMYTMTTSIKYPFEWDNINIIMYTDRPQTSN